MLWWPSPSTHEAQETITNTGWQLPRGHWGWRCCLPDPSWGSLWVLTCHHEQRFLGRERQECLRASQKSHTRWDLNWRHRQRQGQEALSLQGALTGEEWEGRFAVSNYHSWWQKTQGKSRPCASFKVVKIWCDFYWCMCLSAKVCFLHIFWNMLYFLFVPRRGSGFIHSEYFKHSDNFVNIMQLRS